MSYEVKVKIEGVSPLLQHRFTKEGATMPPDKRSGEVDYSGEAEQALYRDERGKIYQPAEHIEGSTIKAAANFKIQGKGKKTYKDLVKSAILVEPFAILHEQQQWTVDCRAVVVNRGRIMRSRPRFDNWSLEFNIVVSEDQIPIETLQAIVEYAGRFVGIGDYRPKYGRFRIVSFKKVV